MSRLPGIKRLVALVIMVTLVGTLLLAAVAPAIVQAQVAISAAIVCVKFDDEGVCIEWAVQDWVANTSSG